MQLTGNTIFITGGGSGIGRGLAEALLAKGNTVIIAGRRKAALEEVTSANPGMHSLELDITSADSINAAAKTLTASYPKLNVLINNAGMMKMDDASTTLDDAQAVATITTNFLGTLRMTSALVEHLKQQPRAAILTTTSGLAFTPLAMSAVYSATKAALHSYILSQRYMLRNTSVEVIEIAPPYVQTELGGDRQKNDPRAMPLDDYIAETMQILATDHLENLVQRVRPLRDNAGPHEAEFVTKFNDMMSGAH